MFIRSTLTVFILNHQGDKNKYQCSTMFDNSTLKIDKIDRKSSGFRYILTVQILTKTLEKGYHFVMDVGDKLIRRWRNTVRYRLYEEIRGVWRV